MIHFSLSFLSGIAACYFFPYFPLSITALFITVSGFLFIKQRKRRKRSAILVLIFLFGFAYSGIRSGGNHEYTFSREDMYVRGTVTEVPEPYNGNVRLTLDRVTVNNKRLEGKVRLSLPEEISREQAVGNPPDVGETISAITRLGKPSVYQNPGVYSYDAQKDGVSATGYIKHMRRIGREKGFFIGVNGLRQKLGERIDSSLSLQSAAFIKAVIPGLKRGIRPELRDAFSLTGLAHLLSISGTHFGLLAIILFTGVKTAFMNLPFRLLNRLTLSVTPTACAVMFTLPVLFVYAFVSGLSTPTVRSLIMICIYMSALLLGRRKQWLNSLSIAAFLILLWKPDELFDVSFQLSFTAVFFIGMVLEQKKNPEQRTREPEKKSLFMKARHRVQTALLITIAAVLGTAPFVILYFKQFPLISPVTNLIITPLVCLFILPLGFFSSFSAAMPGVTSLPFHTVLDGATRFTLSLVSMFSHIPYSSLHIHNPSFLIMGLYFTALIFAIRSRKRWRFIPLSLVILLYAITPFVLRDEHTSVTFLDVGQGEASVVRLPDKRVLLIDGGTQKPDMGRRVIAPFLWSQGIGELDFLVVSHPHPDHYGGLMYIMDHFPVGEIWLNGRAPSEADQLLQKILHKHIPRRVLRRGDFFEGEDYRIYVFHPYNDFFADSPRGEFSDINSDSLVLKFESGGVSVLFTGDIEKEAEEDLSSLGMWLKSTILKVPHHGGRTSNSREFLEAVKPDIAVISAGRHNRFHHPHRETLDRYREIGASVYRTDRDGAVTITFKDNPHQHYTIRTYKDMTLQKVRAFSDETRNIGILLGLS